MNNVLIKFPGDLHNFEKVSKRVNKEGQDKYTCSKCGVVGYHIAGEEEILIKKGNKAAIEECSAAGAGSISEASMKNNNIGKGIRMLKPLDQGDVHLKVGDIKVLVACPDSHKSKYNTKPWVRVGEGDKEEIIMLMEGEYEFVIPEDEPEEEAEVLVEIEENLAEEIDHEAIIEKTNEQADAHMKVIDAGEAEFQKENDQEIVEDGFTELPIEVIEEIAEIAEESKDPVFEAMKKKTGVVQSNEPVSFKEGRFTLEDADKIDYGQRMAFAEGEILKLKGELDVQKKRYKDLISEQEKVVSTLGEAIRNGFEHRQVACELYLDYDNAKRLWRSKQNGNVIKIEEMEPGDYQTTLSYEEKVEVEDE